MNIPLPDLDSSRVSRAATTLILGVADRWSLSDRELARLLGLSSTLIVDGWRRTVPESLPPDTLERISYVLSIYRAINQLLPEDRADAWIHRPNNAKPLLGASALEYMLRGEMRHLLDTQRHLRAITAGGF